jgi:hypothetical protein
MRIVLVLLVAMSLAGCESGLRRTPLPNGYSLDTVHGRFGAIVRPDVHDNAKFTVVWPVREDNYCGAFGWQGSWVVCEVVKHHAGSEAATGQYIVLDTATGQLEVAGNRAMLIERLQKARAEIPHLAHDYPSTTPIH